MKAIQKNTLELLGFYSSDPNLIQKNFGNILQRLIEESEADKKNLALSCQIYESSLEGMVSGQIFPSKKIAERIENFFGLPENARGFLAQKSLEGLQKIYVTEGKEKAESVQIIGAITINTFFPEIVKKYVSLFAPSTTPWQLRSQTNLPFSHGVLKDILQSTEKTHRKHSINFASLVGYLGKLSDVQVKVVQDSALLNRPLIPLEKIIDEFLDGNNQGSKNFLEFVSQKWDHLRKDDELPFQLGISASSYKRSKLESEAVERIIEKNQLNSEHQKKLYFICIGQKIDNLKDYASEHDFYKSQSSIIQ